jgi:Mn-dependent DtxR family transcriptional regulator
MTPRIRVYLWAIERLSSAHGLPPTYRELGVALGVSTQAAAQMCLRLQEAGLVASKAGAARSLRLTDRGREASAQVEAA